MAVITKTRAAGTKKNPKENIPKTQNTMESTAMAHRAAVLAHGPGFQHHTASKASPVKTTGISRGNNAPRPLISTKDAE